MIDIHCHLEYMPDPDGVIKEAKSKMLAIITSVADIKHKDQILALQRKNPDFVFVSLGHSVSFVLVTIVYSLSRSLQSVPTMLPGEVGFIEIVMTYLYIDLLSLGPQAAAISAAATVLTRVLWIWLRLPLGFIALQWIIRKGLL